jgi:alpha-galactosidase
VATFGVDADPSLRADLEFVQAVHHADQRQARPGELRSEWVTVLRAGDAPKGARPIGHAGDTLLVGFEAGTDHDGTLRLRSAGHDRESTTPIGGGPLPVELWVEAFFGGARLDPGQRRRLHGVVIEPAEVGQEPSAMLAEWAADVGRRGNARVGAPYQLGWCSWYQYFDDVTEEHLRANLARAADWPFTLFQLDDGYQAAIGDWLMTNPKFPSGLDALGGAITRQGRTPGLWLAPFLVAPDSEVARLHPDWLVKRRSDGQTFGTSSPEGAGNSSDSGGEPLFVWWNEPWGGGRDGFMYGLDTSHPDVQAHLASLAAALVEAGFDYLKLDFTFAPSADGVYADPTLTPAQRVRAGFESVRAGAGESTFLLGCGVPLANVVGLVDGNRIGQDVAPFWAPEDSDSIVPGYRDIEPATRHACLNTVTRSWMHRRLWLNDPDCLLLRTDDTGLAPSAMRTWARTVALSGGMALVSDDLRRLGSRERAILDEVVAIGTASDAAASAGTGPTVPDLLSAPAPTAFEAAGYRLELDTGDGTSTLVSPE